MKPHHLETDKESALRLYKAFAMLKTTEEVGNFFEDLCTPAEIQSMADRWRVIGPIKEGKPYRQIHDETGVSVTTIGRVARCLQLGTGGYNLIFERMEKKTNESANTATNRNSKKRTSK